MALNILCFANQVLREKINRIQNIRQNETKPLFLFTKPLKLESLDDGAYLTACSFLNLACGDESGKSLLVLDLTDKQYMARSLAHEFGHMVSTK